MKIRLKFMAIMFIMAMFTLGGCGGGGSAGGDGGDGNITVDCESQGITISAVENQLDSLYSAPTGYWGDDLVITGSGFRSNAGTTKMQLYSMETHEYFVISDDQFSIVSDTSMKCRIPFNIKGPTVKVQVLKYFEDEVTASSNCFYINILSYDNPGCTQTPRNIIASKGTETGKVVLSWDVVPGAGYYWIYRSNVGTSYGTLIHYVDTNSYEDTSVTGGTHYYYRIIASEETNSPNQSKYSAYSEGWSSGPSGGTFTPGTGAFSIDSGTYTFSTISYVFKSGNKLDMIMGGTPVAEDVTYSYNTSNGDLTLGWDVDSDGTNDMSYTYHHCFTVTSGGSTYIYMPGFKKTSGTAISIIGTYEYGMSVNTMGTVVDTTMTLTYSADGTYSVTTRVTGMSDTTISGTWDTSANTVVGYNFASIGGNLYMYVPITGYKKQ